MDFHLKKKKALVTGSSAGIGLAIAALLAKEGATVYVNGRTNERVDEAIALIKKGGVCGELIGLPIDLASKQGVEALIKQVPSIDILVNNLGIYEEKEFGQISDEDWLRFFEVNVMSGIRLSRHYLPEMKKKNWGRIVFISSESGINIPSEMIHYGVTKTAQLSLARGLAETTAGTGVTVNSVLPGPTFSEGVKEFVAKVVKTDGLSAKEAEEAFFNTMRPSSLLKRFATTEEVAAMVAFVCSPVASAVNGAALRVDGGIVRSVI